MSTQEEACVSPEQSAAIPCTSTSTSQKETGVSPEQSAAIPCAYGETLSKSGVSSEQSAAIPSCSTSVESCGSVPLVTATPRTLAPLATSTNPDELMKDLLFLSTITSGLPPNKRMAGSEQRLMEFHRLAVEEKNLKAIITVRIHKFIEYLNLDVFVREHLRPGEAPLLPKSPRRRRFSRTPAPSAATSDSGPIKYRDYRIAEGLVAAPAASNTTMSSTPVIATGSASSEAVRSIPSSPASTSVSRECPHRCS